MLSESSICKILIIGARRFDIDLMVLDECGRSGIDWAERRGDDEIVMFYREKRRRSHE